MTDENRFQTYVETWRATADALVALLRSLDEADWDTPTDLPGWDVRAVAAHCAHLESILAGNPQEKVEVEPAAHITGLMGQFTEEGPVARRSWSTARVVDELEQSVAARHAHLLAHPPADLSETADSFAGMLGWTWSTLLSNRPVDLWMHEQDVRRAVGRPGSLDSPGAVHTAGVFARGFGFVVGKRVAPPTGTTVRLVVTGPAPQDVCVEIGADGRASVVPASDVPAEPTATLTLDLESYVVLAGGRRSVDAVRAEGDVRVEGDAELGLRVLEALAVTP